MKAFRETVIWWVVMSSVTAQQGNTEVTQGKNTSLVTTWERGTGPSVGRTNLPMPTTEEDWSPFPAGDVLNNPWLRKIRFCVELCFNETKLQGLRNMWPFIHPISFKGLNNKTIYATRILQKSEEIAADPVLRGKLYCTIIGYPDWGENSLSCLPGNSTVFLDKWKNSPIGMLRDNISLSVFNALLAFLSLILGIFGNMLIIVAILTKTELKSSTNLLLAGMAVADCLNSVTIVFHGYLETFLWSITNPILGPVGCALVNSLKEFSQLAAVNHLITLSFERYFSICWPMKQSLKFTQKKTVLVIIVNWILALVQVIPHLMLNYSLTSPNYIEYICNKTVDSAPWIYVVYNLTIYLVLPVPILCFNYTKVTHALYSRIPSRASEQTSSERTLLKLTYMMITLVVIYIITVTPGRILHAFARLEPLGPGRKFGFIYFKKVSGSIDLVRGMNSWTNVIVYGLISRPFRRAFKEILCCSSKKASEGASGSSTRTGIEETQAETVENRV